MHISLYINPREIYIIYTYKLNTFRFKYNEAQKILLLFLL